ncbi:hypothetical protein [Rhizobium sp. WYCCWR 11146]|uniref:hypothetical protein n=1 Tax=Rhizobium sp. WYCCWR 11146 TaxID=2749833 RepID=UPI0015E6CF47|nr:hypothetical protein [Rhizobium sp. WYCCWR 11146]MBA1348388.1 hypothetical protein [Rhizobium sp. WYCCWR 11146]
MVDSFSNVATAWSYGQIIVLPRIFSIPATPLSWPDLWKVPLINDDEVRSEFARVFDHALDDLVRDRMGGLIEEPDITSRIGQRLEDQLNGKVLHGYRVGVITETITSHGSKSLEKPMGTDLYFAISVENQLGHTTTKGVLVQAKRQD